MKHRHIGLLVGTTFLVLVVVFAGGWLGGKNSTQFGSDFTPVSPQSRVIRYERIALGIWGPVCGGHVSVTVAPLKGRTIGRASYVPHTDGQPLSLPFTHCSIVISSERHWPGPQLCAIVVHEVGHLAGHGHSRNPRSVMYPKLSRQNIPPECK